MGGGAHKGKEYAKKKIGSKKRDKKDIYIYMYGGRGRGIFSIFFFENMSPTLTQPR